MVIQRIPLVFTILSIGFTIMLAVPQFREALRARFVDQNRLVLAKVESQINNDDKNYLILKLKHKKSIHLEIFLKTESVLKLIKKFTLVGSYDGYFNYAGEATNLVVANIDFDPQLEILVPTFDEDFVAHLQIFKFNSTSEEFELLEEDNWPTVLKSSSINNFIQSPNEWT